MNHAQAAAKARALAEQRDGTTNPLKTLGPIETLPVYQANPGNPYAKLRIKARQTQEVVGCAELCEAQPTVVATLPPAGPL